MTDREELAMECDRLDKAGVNVRSFLRSLGYISPWGTWHRLQKEELQREENKITEGKGKIEMGKLTLEQKKQAVEIAISGGNPLDYLKSIGNPNPSAAWYYIRKTLKEADPEKFALLNVKKEPNEEVIGTMVIEHSPAVKETIRAAIRDEKPATCCARSTREGVEVPDELPEDEDVVTGIRTKCGEFRVSNNGFLYFGSNDGDDLEMPVETWLTFAADLPRIMKKLGIVKN